MSKVQKVKIIHGLRIKVLLPIQGDEDVTAPANVYFASARKEPKLKEILKEMYMAEIDEKAVAQKMSILNNEMLEAVESAEVDKIQKKLNNMHGEYQQCQDIFHGGFEKFIKTGLMAAGYTSEESEEFLDILVGRFYEIRALALTGIGMLDFTTEQ